LDLLFYGRYPNFIQSPKRGDRVWWVGSDGRIVFAAGAAFGSSSCSGINACRTGHVHAPGGLM
jgi:hypothetical protein